jgi:beta-lactamase regulating signal transducer with metallopeptidase domain
VIDHLGHALAAWLVPVNAWAAALFACAWLLDRALGRRVRASLRMALYAPVALRVVLPLSWTLPTARLPGGAMLLPLQSLTAAAGSSSSLVSWPAGLAAGYAIVAVVLAAVTVARRASLARALGAAWPSEVPDAPYPVLRHPELGPMVVGLLEPRIVMPDALLDGATAETLACVVKHEAAHVRRGDPWLAAGMEWLLVACWPVAALWLAVGRVRHLMELACDEAALSGADASERRRYGHVLLDVAEHGPMAFSSAGSLHFGSTLRARIEAIAMHHPWPRAVQAGLATLAVAALVACSSAESAVAPQAAGGARPASTGGAVDQYGYEYETDLARSGAAAKMPTPAPASDVNENGRLAPEVIQGVVRASFGRFRACYEAGLGKDARLQGRVTVSFVIEPDGTVQNAADQGSSLTDTRVVQCVVDGFGRLHFPPPQGGYVTVIYPIEFNPGD